MTKQVIIPGSGLIHSHNMLKNLEYAYKVKDTHFIKTWTPVFFGRLSDDDHKMIVKAFETGSVEILPGENDGDAILKY